MKTDQAKTVLIFAYYWPPASGPGVQRWLKFVKYLPEKGWNTIVVTPENGSYPNTDPTLLNDVPDNVCVERTKTLEPFRLFNLITGQANRGNTTSVGMGDIKGSTSIIKKISGFIRANFFIPDARKGWVKFAVEKGKELIEKNQIDLIVTTGPPHSAHLIGLKLKKEFKLPWVADLRDPWTNIYYNKFLPRTQNSNKKDSLLETKVIQTADAITVVGNGQKDEFESRAQHIKIIENGYDEEDFSNLKPSGQKDVFRLSYIGNLKVNQNCTTLWKVIYELADEIEGLKDNFRLSFTGNIHSEVSDTLNKMGIIQLVEILPFVPHDEAVQRMVDAQALLFLIPESSSNKQIITGKIFEYLASGTPLLSIGPTDGDASRILATCNRSPMLDYSDKKNIKAELLRAYKKWLDKDEPIKIVGEEHSMYSRKNLTFKLADLFEETIS
ncbi:MAG: glycosyltransferase family 4 protein [Balneolaceae bacterium]|nr:glycosyltransferase family 4 protein [Balneolaceae bacterium]MBO6546053.1 glycosyltransferase family 4 protein [Balneolaceae bacterium]MBO6647449.1 glycosyltransferase family 4 protein [Balneolaceae bacterium]